MGHKIKRIKKHQKKREHRLLVTADTHGQYLELKSALELAKFNPKYDFLIHLGDMIDRGPRSREVIEEMMRLTEKGCCQVLIGNHEMMFLDVLFGKLPLDLYFKNGGESTLNSFDIDARSDNYTLEKARRKVGYDVIDWLLDRPLYLETDKYIFVHAGIRPGVPLEHQKRDDILWIREEFYMNYKEGKKIFFGHTPTQHLHGKKGKIWLGYNSVGIDTGAGAKHYVTVVEVDTLNCFQKKVWK